MTLRLYPSANDIGGGKTLTETALASLLQADYGFIVSPQNTTGMPLLVAAGLVTVYGRRVYSDAGITSLSATPSATNYIAIRLTQDANDFTTAVDIVCTTSMQSDTGTYRYRLIAVAVTDATKVLACNSWLDGAIHLLGNAGEPAFQNGWGDYGGGFISAAYMKDAHNRVTLRGIVAAGAVPSAIFTLPEGYRPGGAHIFPALSNGHIGRIKIDSNGSVTAESPSETTWLSLDGVTFVAGC